MTTSRLDPAATYRLQLGPACTFADAARAVDDIAALGVSHLYLSPVAEAVTGSTHGYDVVRPDQVRAALGGADGLRALCERARDAGLGVIVDLVPNHTSAVEPHRNPWWWSLLAEGREGPAADVFDVDWAVADGRVVVPALGRPLDEAIAAGELTIDEIDLDAATPNTATPNDVPTRVVRYWERVFPLRADGPRPEVGATPREVADALAAQHYELQFWREPRRNVRRFFTIDDLVAIRPEVDRVFDAAIAPVADLIDEGLVDGVRLDHIDGLADPLAYLDRLRERLGDSAWILVEKIVVGDERLGDAWAADGTTGYEWITLVDHVFTHPDGEDAITSWWHRVTGDDVAYHHHEQRGVRDVLDGTLRPDLERVTRSARAVPGSPAERAIVALTVALGRYRTYLDGGSDEHHLAERAVMAAAAKRASKHLDAAGRDALAGIVTELAGTEPADIGSTDEFRTRWQQLTGPALAKGGEDRALYRSMRLSAHNEVGGDPGRWTTSLDAFHDHNAWVAGHLPRTLLASSTHDTKRSEDVRARLLALTAMADEWVEQADAWLHPDDAADLVPTIGGPAASLAVQTAVAAWPIDADRLGDYLVKAGREAELLTSWIDVDDAHEAALRRVARHLCEKRAKEITAFVDRIGPAARAISLAQLVVRLTAPGVPDVYQGAERWLRTLVDPDNRAPLDHDALREVVAAIDPDGDPFDAEHPKAAVMARVLHARRAEPAPFGPGAVYEPLAVSGPHADDAIAFTRRDPEGAGVVTVAARFPVSAADHGWVETTVELPAGEWVDLLQPTDRRTARTGSIPMADLLGDRPAAVLTGR
ncbi:MAG: malto-oligosyltrehalose synthase [Acidimicrobiales bacterium]